MRRKKQFVAPCVLQAVNLQLEEDLLAGPSVFMMIIATGQEVDEYAPDSGYESPWLD